MNNFKNMKFEVTVEQPLEGIVRELEKKGYVLDKKFHRGLDSKSILTWDDGSFEGYKSNMSNIYGLQVVSLAELKEM